MLRPPGVFASAAAALAVLMLAGCGPSRPARLTAAPAAEVGVRPVPSIYPAAASVRMFVASDVRSEKPAQRYERRWLNPPDGFALNDAQAARLRRALVDAPVPNAVAACFIPHHFFRFYDKAGRQIGEVKICFCCQAASSEPSLVVDKDRMLGARYQDIAALVTEVGGSIAVDCSADEKMLLTRLPPRPPGAKLSQG